MGRVLNGRYELRSVIGRGGMAEVWMADDHRLRRSVAVKLLASNEFADRFQHECRTAARLSHANIVGVYDVGVDGGTPYMVMELVPGHSLADELTRGPIPVPRAVWIAGQVCDALSAAHAAGVVHRDVKPANILLSDEGRVKVCDFGIARTADLSLTATGTVFGTSQYMAPEQVNAGPVDARTDLYALGCVLYAMLTGRPPFTVGTPVEIAFKQVHEAPPPLSGFPAHVVHLVAGLLAKRPADRPSSAAQVRVALNGAPARGVAAVRPATRPLPAAPVAPVRRPGRSAAIALAALGATAVAVLVVALGALSDRPNHPAAAPTTAGSGSGTAATTTAPPAADIAPPAAESAAASGPAAADQAVVTLAAVRAAVQAADDLDGTTSRELNRRLDLLSRDLKRGNTERAAADLADLRDRLTELRQNGALTTAGYTAIVAPVDKLAANLPE